MRYRIMLLGAFSTLLAVASAVGQTTSGTIRGRILDPQGAPVPKVAVTVTGQGNGLIRTVSTDADGTFVVSNLPPGTVDLAAVAAGFADIARTDLVLEVGRTLSLDLDLTIGNVRETVVVDSAVGVDTSRSVVDAVIPSSFIDVFPLNGRNFLELALLVPGNAPAPNFDPTKIELGAHLVCRPARSRRQHHDRRRRQQRRRGGRTAAERDTGGGAGISDRHQPLLGRVRPLGGLGHQHHHQVGHRPAPRLRVAVSARRQLAGLARDLRSPTETSRSTASSSPAPPAGPSGAAALLVRRHRVPQPGWRHPGGDRATWRRERSDGPSRPRRSTICSHRRVSTGVRTPTMACRSGTRPSDADDTAASTLDRAIGSASQRQASENRYQSIVGDLDSDLTPTLVNAATVVLQRRSATPSTRSPLSRSSRFPSIQDGTSFRVPQGTTQTRFQLATRLTLVRGRHTLRLGGEWQSVARAASISASFRQGRIEFVQDFAEFDHNGDGRVDDGDLLFSVTLRSGKPDQDLVIDDADNNHIALFVQDDWRVRPDLTLNLGLRYEIDTDVKNISRVDEINPIVQPFLVGERKRDLNNFGPRIGFNWAPGSGRTSVHGGYGIYYDRVTLRDRVARARPRRPGAAHRGARRQRVLPRPDDRPASRRSRRRPPTRSRGSSFRARARQASTSSTTASRTRWCSSSTWESSSELPQGVVLRVDGVHNLGTHFIIGRTIGEVFNPVVGGPDRVVNLESSVSTHYDALLVSVERRGAHSGFSSSYALAKASNYANDDQIPFGSGPIDPNDLRREYRADAERSAPPLHVRRAGSRRPAGSSSRRS